MKRQIALSSIILFLSTASLSDTSTTESNNTANLVADSTQATQAPARGVTLSCDTNTFLFPQQTFSTDTENLDVLADRSEISQKDTYLLTGNVSLLSSEYYLAADAINIQKSTKTSSAQGNVKFQDDKLMFVGDKATVKKQGDALYTTAEEVKFQYPKSKINGQAKKVTNDGTEQIFDSASYSLCPLGNTDWRMIAKKITLNSTTNRGTAEDVTVEFLGVPIFYAPKHEWVLEGRGSGFLAPSFSSYDEAAVSKGSNYQIKIPYYFNLALDRDLLLTLNQLSSRGSVIEGIYRQLIAESEYWQGGRIEIEGQYLDKDAITNKKRWLFNSEIDLYVNDKTRINASTNRVSDADYFKDITHNNTSESSLHSEVNATYSDDERQFILSLFAEEEQLINNGEADYMRAIELSTSKDFEGTDGRNINTSLVRTNFEHDDVSNTTGVRTHAEINFERSISTDAYSLTPHLDLSATDYELDNTANQDRSIYSFGIDSKVFLEKEVNLFGLGLTQTLTPRLSYNYTPKQDQSNLPNFDSFEKNSSYEDLFSGEKFTGVDRINNANSFTLGFESEFVDEKTGDTYLNLKVAQVRNNDDEEMDNSGTLIDSIKYSDISTSADFSFKYIMLNNTTQFDPVTNEVSKQDNSVTYQVNARKFFTIARHDDDGERSAELYGAYPLNHNVHVFAGINRSITDSITNQESTGIAYESCCWSIRLAHFKKYTDEGGYDYVTDFELVLKGLATTSSNLEERLKANIPNYLANFDE